MQINIINNFICGNLKGIDAEQYNAKVVMRQLSSKFKDENIIFKFNSREDIVWDAVVVFGEFGGLPYNLKVCEGMLFFLAAEPPVVKVYSRQFMQQFDAVVTSHTNTKHPNVYLEQQSLLWFFGLELDFKNENFDVNYNFAEIEALKPEKCKIISAWGTKRNFLPGHIERYKFIETLQKRYGSAIEVFGNGFNSLSDKAPGLLPFKFSICMENCCINDYWSEKLADCFLGYSIPLYYGCKNIDNYFSPKSYIAIDLRNKKETFRKIDDILHNADTIYEQMFPYLLESRNKLLYEYNIFPHVLNLMAKQNAKYNKNNIRTITLQPESVFSDNVFPYKMLKIKRMMNKYFFWQFYEKLMIKKNNFFSTT